MIPDGRTTEYAIWRACERFGIRPPSVQAEWDECHPWLQAMLLGYDQIRQVEEHKRDVELAKIGRAF